MRHSVDEEAARALAVVGEGDVIPGAGLEQERTGVPGPRIGSETQARPKHAGSGRLGGAKDELVIVVGSVFLVKQKAVGIVFQLGFGIDPHL